MALQNSINQFKSNTWIGDPAKVAVRKWIIIDPDGTFDGIEYDNRRSVLNELMNTDIGDELKDQYCEGLDHKFDEDEFDSWAYDNFERVAEEMNYRIFEIGRMK